MKRTALLSVYDKNGIVEFAQGLIALGWDILASGGTHRALAEAGISAKNISDIVGKPILGHRVVTLSREIHAALLSRNDEEDNAELAALGVPRIDLLCVDLYPLEEAVRECEYYEKVVEKTDIGGPAMLRAAAKGGRIVVCEPELRSRILYWLKYGEIDGHTVRRWLAARAELVVSRYGYISARYLARARDSWPDFPAVEVAM